MNQSIIDFLGQRGQTRRTVASWVCDDMGPFVWTMVSFSRGEDCCSLTGQTSTKKNTALLLTGES